MESTGTLSSPLSKEEYIALPEEMKRNWAQGIAVKAKFRALPASAKTAKEKTLAAGKRYTPKASEREISAIVAAYRTGQERLLVWKMECTGFDEAFLKDLASKL
ncbi:hypothetical protein C8Q74DRAFT_1373879 [Fomes fomentarius]|nr:hypothetical protein C8Q74DRAFT_1373879 [Fomes fomentarius]